MYQYWVEKKSQTYEESSLYTYKVLPITSAEQKNFHQQL